jgi:radical SAM protein with 4Fe4S-binding SPASM domain
MFCLDNTTWKDNSLQVHFTLHKNNGQFRDAVFSFSVLSGNKKITNGIISEHSDSSFSVTIHDAKRLVPGNSFLLIEIIQAHQTRLLGKWEYTKEGFKKEIFVKLYPNRMIGLSLTNACNLNCSMCWQQNRKEKHFLKLDAIKKIVDSVALSGRPPVYLWGGEPLMHPQVWDIINYLKSKFFFTIMNTNGFLLKDNIRNIMDSKVDMLIVSIDGLEETHNTVRKSNTAYSRMIGAIKELQREKRRRPIVTINCVVNEHNYDRLHDLVVLKEELKAEYLEFQFMMFFSKHEKEVYKDRLFNQFGKDGSSVQYYPENRGKIELETLQAQIDEIRSLGDSSIRFFPYALNTKEKLDNYYQNPGKIGIHKCTNIENSVWVEPNGDIVPCSCFPDYPVGNIYKEGFYDIWNGEKFIDFRQKMDNKLFSICHRCCDLYKTDFFQSNSRPVMQN